MTVVGYQGKIEHDGTMPDGPPRKMMENSRLASLDWAPQYELSGGLEQTYEWFLKTEARLRQA